MSHIIGKINKIAKIYKYQIDLEPILYFKVNSWDVCIDFVKQNESMV